MTGAELREASENVGACMRDVSANMQAATAALADLCNAVATLAARAQVAAHELDVIDRIRANISGARSERDEKEGGSSEGGER